MNHSSGLSKESQLTIKSLWRAAVAATLIVAGLLLMMYPERVSGQEPPATGKITIVKDTDPESNNDEFCYDVQIQGPDPSDFCLEDDESRTLTLEPGRVLITEVDAEPEWDLVSIVCLPVSDRVDYNLRDASVEINLRAGNDYVCTFTSEEDEEPTPTATVQPTATASPQPTATRQPQFECTVGNLKFFVDRPTDCPQPTPVPQATVAPAAVQQQVIPPTANTIRPPSTGDGGLIREGEEFRTKLAFVSSFLFCVILVAYVRIMARLFNNRRR